MALTPLHTEVRSSDDGIAKDGSDNKQPPSAPAAEDTIGDVHQGAANGAIGDTYGVKLTKKVF